MIAKTNSPESASTVHYNTIRIGDIDLFYSEPGAKNAPLLLMLHGYTAALIKYALLVHAVLSTTEAVEAMGA